MTSGARLPDVAGFEHAGKLPLLQDSGGSILLPRPEQDRTSCKLQRPVDPQQERGPPGPGISPARSVGRTSD